MRCQARWSRRADRPHTTTATAQPSATVARTGFGNIIVRIVPARRECILHDTRPDAGPPRPRPVAPPQAATTDADATMGTVRRRRELGSPAGAPFVRPNGVSE